MIYGNCLCLADWACWLAAIPYELDQILYYIKAPLKIKEDIGVKADAPALVQSRLSG